MPRPKLSPRVSGKHSSWPRAGNSVVMRPSAVFNIPPQLWLEAWRAVQAPSIGAMCQLPPPQALPQAHLVGTALWQTRGTCWCLTEAVTCPEHHISSLFGMRGESRCNARPGLALLLSLARWGAGRTPPTGAALAPSALIHPSGAAATRSHVGKVVNVATGFWCFQESIALGNFCLQLSLVPAWQMKSKWDYLKAFQLGLNFRASQFKTK